MKGLWLISMFILLMAGYTPVDAQTESDSVRFLTALDSAEALYMQDEFESAITLAQNVVEESEEKGRWEFTASAYLLISRIHSFQSNWLRARAMAKKALAVSQENGQHQLTIKAASILAGVHFNFSEYDSAKTLYILSADVAGQHVPERYGISLSNVGFIYGVINDREKELEAYLKSLDAVDSIPDSFRASGVRAAAYSSLGDYYAFIEDYEKANIFYNKKLVLSRETNSKEQEFEALYGLGSLYRKSGLYSFEKSKAFYETIVEEAGDRMLHYSGRARIALGRLHREEKLYEEALVHYQKADEYYSTTNSSDFKAAVRTEMAQTYLELNQFSETRKWLRIALEAAREKNLRSRERDALRTLYKLDSIQGRYRDALMAFQRLKVIEDTLRSERVRKSLQEMKVKYETEQTEKENLELRTDLELKEAQVQRQRITQAFVVVVALAFTIIALVVYFNYQRKRKDHETIAQQADELRKLSRFKDGLTGMVVHDMRNPLNAILGFSQGTPTDEKLQSINSAGNRVLNLVNNMLDIQRFEEAQVDLKPEVFDARQAVADAINQVQLLVAGKSLKIRNQLPVSLSLNADQVLFNRVLVNLLTNAVKYSKSGGDILVEAGNHTGANQELIVQDQGQGIAAKELPHIFDKFWHNDPERSGMLPSTGLGLSFCKLAVEAHGGEIRAESVLYEGTSMIFSFPLAGEPAATEVHVDQQEMGVAVSTEDMAVYHRFLPDLEGLQIHQVSAITKLIKTIETMATDKLWSTEIRAAAYQGDQERYRELLDRLRENVNA